MLFRSTSYQRDETELVIIVTPYLVRPVSGSWRLPADGYRAPTDAQLISKARLSTAAARCHAPTAVPAVGHRRRLQSPLRGSSCDPRFYQEGCNDAFQIPPRCCREQRPAGCASAGGRDLPDRGIAAVNVPVVTTRRLCVRRGCSGRSAWLRAKPPAQRLVPGPRPRLRRFDLYRWRLRAMPRASRLRESPASTACWSATARPSPPAPSSPERSGSWSRAAAPKCPAARTGASIPAELRQPHHVQLRLRGESATSPCMVANPEDLLHGREGVGEPTP